MFVLLCHTHPNQFNIVNVANIIKIRKIILNEGYRSVWRSVVLYTIGSIFDAHSSKYLHVSWARARLGFTNAAMACNCMYNACMRLFMACNCMYNACMRLFMACNCLYESVMCLKACALLTAALGKWPLQHYQTSIPLAGKL